MRGSTETRRERSSAWRWLPAAWLMAAGCGAAAYADAEPPPIVPEGYIDPLRSLRVEAGDYSSALDVRRLEPPGGEEYLTQAIMDVRLALDAELEFLQAIGVLPKDRTSVRGAFDEADRRALLEQAERAGCDSPKSLDRTPGRINGIAKRWRKAIEKLPRLEDEPSPAEVHKLVASDYDSQRWGAVDAEGLYRLRRRVEWTHQIVDLYQDQFLEPVRGSTEPVADYMDWKLLTQQRTPFGQEVTTPQGRRKIENIVQETILIGSDDAFPQRVRGDDSYDFRGYFLHSRQALTEDDVTTTVVLVESPELDPLVNELRSLVADYARVRAFRIEQMEERPAPFVSAEVAVADLIPQARDLQKAVSDPEETLEELQKLFGAPVGRRTRTRDFKIISWTAPLTALDEDLNAEMRLPDGSEGSGTYRLLFNVEGTGIGSAARFSDLQLGTEVTLVGKVARLEYADAGPPALQFTLTPLVQSEATEALPPAGKLNAENDDAEKDDDRRDKKKEDDKKKKEPPRRPRGAVRGGDIG